MELERVPKAAPDLYPDLVALGGLAGALQSALRDIGSSLTISELTKSVIFVAYARVESGARFSQVYIAVEERLFLFDFWARGVMLARGQTPDLEEAARAIDRWATSNCLSAELAAAYKFVTVENGAQVYERGEEVEQRWQTHLKSINFSELVPLVQAAARRPPLRQLFPYTSLNMFCFSRTTGYPFTRDTPHVRPLTDGRYEVVSATGTALGSGDAEQAADLVVSHLPPGCGPAVAGTAHDLERNKQ
jgi:hypothetical protein